MPRFDHLPLVTARLTLRPLSAADADAVFAIFSDPQTMRWWSCGPWQSVERAHQMISADEQRLAEGQALRLGLVRHDDGQLIGVCSMFDFNAQSRRAEFGYILARAHWGHGHMHEALTAFIDYAFGTLGLHRLEADTDPRNTASKKALLRLGCVQEGLFRERWIIEGEVCDSAMFGLLARDWHARRGG